MEESRTSRVFVKTVQAYADTQRFVSSCGGTRSGKTFSNLQLLIYLAGKDTTPTITSVVSETLPHLKRGAIRDFQAIWGSAWDETRWNKTDAIYTFPNGSIVEFFSADSPAKVHGPARDRLFLNEAQNISHEVARQLFVRTRGKVLIDYNPTHAFWVMDKIEPQPNCIKVHSTYKDNCDSITGQPFLSANQLAEIESNRSDANWWRVYGEGLVGVLEGLIFPDFEQIDSLPADGNLIDVYGLDFGFTHDPSVLQHCLIDTARRIIYVDEVFYQRGMLNSDMADAMRAEGVSNRAEIYADAAEPKTIAELGSYGFNIRACYKATRKAEQLQALKGYALKVTKRSVNTIRELRGYTWAKDKDGNFMNEPIAINDHAMDAMRYGCFSYMEQYGLSQRLSFGFGNFSL